MPADLESERVKVLSIEYLPHLPDDDLHERITGLESMCNHILLEGCLTKIKRQIQARQSSFDGCPGGEADVLALAVYDRSFDDSHALHDPRHMHQAIIKMRCPALNTQTGKWVLSTKPWEVIELPDGGIAYPDGPTATPAWPSNRVAVGRPAAVIIFGTKTDDIPLLAGEDDASMRSMRTCDDLVSRLYAKARFEAYASASSVGRWASLEMIRRRLDQVLDLRKEDLRAKPLEYDYRAPAIIWGFDMETDCVFKCQIGGP